MQPFAIHGAGMVTGVGFSKPATCAAIRAAISGFKETKFHLGGELVIGCEVPLEGEPRGRERLLRMAFGAVDECIAPLSQKDRGRMGVILCLAEPDRPGRSEGLDQSFLDDLLDSIQAETTVRKVSQILMDSRVSGLRAIEYAQKQSTSLVSSWIIAGVDTYLTSQTLGAFSERNRLKTERNSNGFIPGEAAAAVLLKREPCQSGLSLVGLGFGRESATVESDLPLRSDGLSQAINEAFQSYGGSFKDVDYRIADVNGEEYGFKEGALALARTMRIRKSRFDTLHPADCVGEIGAASVPLMLGFVQDAHLKGYAPGSGVLLHTSNDNSERGAAILMATS